jgi:protease I
MKPLTMLCVALALVACRDPNKITRGTDPDKARPVNVDVQKHGKLAGKRVAILATDGVQDEELSRPRAAFEDEGATTAIVAPGTTFLQTEKQTEQERSVKIDAPLAAANPNDYDALFIPGGLRSPDTLRTDPRAIAFVKAFLDNNKPIAAICHGPWLLIDAGGVKGKQVTSWPSLRADLTNAGAVWVDAPVAVDKGLVTGRKPADIPRFDAAAITLFAGVQNKESAKAQ